MLANAVGQSQMRGLTPCVRQQACSYKGFVSSMSNRGQSAIRASFLLRMAFARFSSTRYTTTASTSGIRK